MPVGVITARDVSAAPSSSSLVADVMSHECVAIDPSADERATEHRFLEAAWGSLQRRRPLSDDTLERRAIAGADPAARDLRPPTEDRSDLETEGPRFVRCS